MFQNMRVLSIGTRICRRQIALSCDFVIFVIFYVIYYENLTKVLYFFLTTDTIPINIFFCSFILYSYYR